MSQKFWMGDAPAFCDISGEVITDKFIDGRTAATSSMRAVWANMSPKTHARLGVGLGNGKGQEYTKQLDGRWLKTGG